MIANINAPWHLLLLDANEICDECSLPDWIFDFFFVILVTRLVQIVSGDSAGRS